jgi:DMSO/TMAO reductase YedYZ molybdopterin-dependent catalytic subunit
VTEQHEIPRLSVAGALEGPALALDGATWPRCRPPRRCRTSARWCRAARVGACVLAALLERARPSSTVRWLNIASQDPAFAVSVAIDEVRDAGIVVYELDGAPLAREKGGPFRLLVPGHADECLNVKQLLRLELSATAGRDTRPKDDAEHAALHRKSKT